MDGSIWADGLVMGLDPFTGNGFNWADEQADGLMGLGRVFLYVEMPQGREGSMQEGHRDSLIYSACHSGRVVCLSQRVFIENSKSCHQHHTSFIKHSPLR